MVQVSVVIPTYNYAPYIAEAIQSIQAQTFRDLEIIVVDDGSTDETQAVLSRIKEPRMRLHRIPNSGVAVARNVGYASAQGRYIAQLDGDDRWRPTMLERTVAVLDSEPDVVAVFTDMVRFNGDNFWPHTQFDFIPELKRLPSRPSAAGGGRVLLGDGFAAALDMAQFPAYLQATVVRADAASGVRFPPGIAQADDLFFMLQVYQRGAAAFIPEPLVEVRRHQSNSYRDLMTKVEADLAVLRMLARRPMSAKHAALIHRRVGRAWLGLAYHYFHDRRPFSSARASIHALGHCGSRLGGLKRLALLPALPLLADRRRIDWSRVPQTSESERQ